MSFKWWPVRRTVQFLVLALIASPWAGLAVFRGNLAAGDLFGLSLADPLAFLQATLASRQFVPSFLLSAAIVTAFYFLVGGRTFCGWICPVYLLTELGEKLRARFGGVDRSYSLNGTRWAFAVTLVVSLAAGIPLFEVLSPLGITARAIMFRAWLPLLLPLAILIVELFVARRIWCRSLCPVGGFYSLIARFSPLRVGFETSKCNHCGVCREACPVEEVLAPSLESGARQVVSGHCTRCMRCLDSCRTKAFRVNLTYR
ncbi:NapH/MauN family ferredoxin-type protein [Geomesophilobacter sediminis]|uniref:NapH/MauN family ferredoxin-type protein n=1 Tax=Geomesophilobacter sediminis TaxID=2798584 RepID=A0A8J7JEV0_9BACT|nr:NapH/MauN family ferredoxin-type protein [Geomesophilobacter sediminis]MBJ6724689.1 NapH/MauN family ferredoxin-type protein [Geomesophilobacter sediminis]